MTLRAPLLSSLLALSGVAACGTPVTTDDLGGHPDMTTAAGSDMTAPIADEKQNPPTTGRVDVEAWLAKGLYKSWHCEAAQHDARSPSPHGKNRICSNDKTSANAGGEYAVDSAGVKELYDDTGMNVVGYAVYRHVTAGKTGDTWYWYERVPANSPAPHDANGVVADGTGGSGPAKAICVGCHSATGSDAMHSGHDFVYTQVK